jgi:acetoin utilization deacetylase AcuC-like enzyme
MGFCLLNNVALATQYLLDVCSAERIAIVDIDLHHGNGTQDIFWERGDVFYISTHQSPLYPGSGQLHETGSGAGKDTTANFPLPPASGDQAFKVVADEWILPLLGRFQPEMLLVSFGFDPHWRDPLGHLQLSAAGMYRLIAKMSRWADENCQGRIALALEGGYDLEAAGACACAAVSGLLGIDYSDPLGASPRQEGISWERVLTEAKALWLL